MGHQRTEENHNRNQILPPLQGEQWEGLGTAEVGTLEEGLAPRSGNTDLRAGVMPRCCWLVPLKRRDEASPGRGDRSQQLPPGQDEVPLLEQQ